MSARIRLSRRAALVLVLAAVAVGALTAVAAARRSSSARRIVEYLDDYHERGGTFEPPAALERTNDINSAMLAAGIITCVVVGGLVLLLVAMRRFVYRLDDTGLSWSSSWGLRWRGPIGRADLAGVEPGVTARTTKVIFPAALAVTAAFAAPAARRVGLLDRTVLYLRSAAGTAIDDLTRAVDMDDARRPADTSSFLLVVEAVLATNPDFANRFDEWTDMPAGRDGT